MSHQKRNRRTESTGTAVLETSAGTLVYSSGDTTVYETDCPVCGKEWTVKGLGDFLVAPVCRECR